MSTKGDRSKYKTKKYFEKKGYQCAYSEVLRTIVKHNSFTGAKDKIFIKKDTFGSDLIAMNKKEIIFINSTTKENVSKKIKKFLEYDFPPFVKRAVVYWEDRAKEPFIRYI